MFRINFQSLSGTTTFYNLKHGYLSSLFPIPTLCPGHAAAAAKLLQSCLTLCDSMDCSLPGFSVHGFLQARTLEWVAISFSNAWKWKVKVKSLSRVWLLATPWTAAYQAPPSMGFSRQEYWSGLPLPSLIYCLTSFNMLISTSIHVLQMILFYSLSWLNNISVCVYII